MKKRQAPGDYQVGYGKPPRHTRFKPGQSGNSKGRSKGSKNLRSLLKGALFKKMRVTEDGQVRTMSRVEAIVTGLVAKALKGDVRATESVLRLVKQHFPAGEEPQEMRVFLQRFTDGKILGEVTPQKDSRGRSSESHAWSHLLPKKATGEGGRLPNRSAKSSDDDAPDND